MKIALIQQPAIPDREANIRRGLINLAHAAKEGADLVVFPELAFDRFFPQYPTDTNSLELAETIPGPTTALFAAQAKEHGVVVVLNLFEEEGGRTFDSSPVIDNDGTILGVTRMVHIADCDCFYEKNYYTPGDHGAPVYDTAIGKLGVAICYDRHYPEYMRALALNGAELVVIPQAGTINEWPKGVFEAELQTAALQNGYFTALVNRVGKEDKMVFAGESFITAPSGEVIARAPAGEEFILCAEIDLSQVNESPGRKLFLRDRRPEIYPLSEG
ncbi:MAG: carbon-nitrogen hydrolase family protein [FCB group bacterium]|nr:carbon-nitrogen hydrolase family protein [FCB group bacterium]